MGAAKTFYGVLANWNGEDMDALIVQENRSSILNNPGDPVSVGALELITFESDFDLVAGVDVYEVVLVQRSDHSVYMANARGKIYIPADVAGNYEIDSVAALNRQGFDSEAQYAPETRSVDDDNDVNFFWPTNPATITGEVQFTEDDTWQPVVGTIGYVDQYGDRYMYRLPYNAANKPGGEGYARFRLTDDTGRVHYSQINYIQAGEGNGSISWSIEIKDINGAVIPFCDCWVASDVDGNDLVSGVQVTGLDGLVEFLLDPGTYYLFLQKTGYTFNNPSTITVTG